jgi:hypothetical protein
MGIIVVLGVVFIIAIIVMVYNQTDYGDSKPEEKLPSEFIAAMSVAGINKHGCQMKHVGTFVGQLVAEPNNDFDANAIKVMHSDGTHLGYIKKEETDTVRQMLGKDFKPYPVVGQVKFVEEKDEEDEEEPGENLVLVEDAKAGYFVARIYIDSAHL